MKKSNLLCLLIFTLTSISLSSQIFVNRVFQDGSGSPTFNPVLNPLGVQWSKSIPISTGELVTVGHTSVGGQEDIYVIKYDPEGNRVFEQNYDFGFNEYGTDICEAANGDFLICGTTDNGGLTNFDVLVLRISAWGTFISSDLRDGPFGKNDFAVGILEDPVTGDILVAANTGNSGNIFDYWAIKWNSNLSFNNENFYDYAGLNDMAIGIQAGTGGEFALIGASQNGAAFCDYAIATFKASSMNLTGDARSSLPGVAQDKALAFCRDANNNTYITGQAWNGNDFDIKTVMITSNMTLGWSITTDLHGKEDAGVAILLDPVSGEVVVGGFATKANTKKEIICIRYNGTTGSIINTPYAQSAEAQGGDAFIKKLAIHSSGSVYFIGGEKNTAGNMQVVVGKLNTTPRLVWQRKITSLPGDDLLPSDIEVSGNGIFAISVLDSVTDSYITTEFSEFTLDTSKTYQGSRPVWKKNELIVSFLPAAINRAAIDNQAGTAITEYGNISDFLTTAANTDLDAAFKDLLKEGKIKAVKIDDRMKTTDTVAVTRMGEDIAIPSFWSTLLLQFPSYISLQQAGAALKMLPHLVSYAHPNYFMEPLTNDPLYSSQASLESTTNLTNIHVDEAWNIAQDCGSAFVRGGIFDTGVEWQHEDFGYTGSTTSGKVNGWYFDPNPAFPAGGQDIRTQLGAQMTQDQSGHGTCVAGIIGAERNNALGVAGIAGGDGATNNPGVSLFTLNTGKPGVSMYYLLRTLYETSFSNISSINPYRYGLNFSNHSYKITYNTMHPDSFAAYREKVHFATRMKITIIAARGNDGLNNPVYPATFDSTWILSVGGLDNGPSRWAASSYGSGMDVLAPAKASMIRSVVNANTVYGAPGGDGTSNSAPHVSGVVGLLMSYMNDPTGQNPYINLAPEDCEYIIDHSASDLAPFGYDAATGFGMLHAGNALKMVQKPKRLLYHYGTNFRFPYSLTKQLYSAGDTIILTEKYENQFDQMIYNSGKYFVKTFKITANVLHTSTFPSDSLMYYWPRHSSSYVYPLPDAQNRLNMHERVTVNSINGTGALLSGFTYQVWDTQGNFKGWWPCDTSFSALYTGLGKPKTLMEYTILTKNKAVGLDKNSENSQTVSLFPNPASQRQSILIQHKKEEICRIELYDLTGQFIKIVFDGKTQVGQTYIYHDVSTLSNSMYIYIIKLGDVIVSKKFIKQE